MDATCWPGQPAPSQGEALSARSLQVLPELTSQAVDELPILKADALKFLTLMRGQLSTQAVMATFGNLAALLRADSNVVHSYAALAIERLLASRVGAKALLAKVGNMGA